MTATASDAGRKLSASAGGAGRDGLEPEVETRLSKRNASTSDEVKTFFFTMRKPLFFIALRCAAAMRPRRRLVGWMPSLHALDEQSDAHAATDAQGRQTAFGLAPLHFVQQSGRNAHAGATDRMTQCDCAAVHVQSILIEFKVAITGNDLCGERLVEFDQIDFPK